MRYRPSRSSAARRYADAASGAPASFEVDGVKEQVAILEPFRSPSMQRLSLFAEERSVGGVPDQRVPECDFLAARAQHSRARKPRQVQLASAKDVSEDVGIKTLAKRRSRLNHVLVSSAESVDTGKDQSSQGGGQVGANKFVGVAQSTDRETEDCPRRAQGSVRARLRARRQPWRTARLHPNAADRDRRSPAAFGAARLAATNRTARRQASTSSGPPKGDLQRCPAGGESRR